LADDRTEDHRPGRNVTIPGDDRQAFEEDRRTKAMAMGADAALAAQALALLVAADAYDYSYQWTWLGVPIIQMPPDIVSLQEIVWSRKPQLIIETGVARGGSVIFFASLLQLIGEGTVVGIDIDIRPHNRHSIESHPLAQRVTLIQGSSTDPVIVDRVREMATGIERVMVVLDSNHTHEHVLDELRAYSEFVTPGQYIVVADTMIENMPPRRHRSRPWGPGNSPMSAVREFLAADSRYEVDHSVDSKMLLTASPGGFLRRKDRS
jgi:cephalosporin hydroxylase